MTPTKEMIQQRALELWRNEQFQRGCPEMGDITPEMEELKEGGFVSSAVSELMRNETTEWSRYGDMQKPKQPERPENLAINGVPFDVALAVDSGFYVSGTSQSGKTNLAKHLVSKLLGYGITCYVLDSSKAWTHDTPISDVLHVDTTIKTYVWRGSTVFDISALNARQKVIFVNQLCHDIYEAHVDGFSEKEFLIFEEAQSYLAQGSMKLATRRATPCESVLDVITCGANYGLRFGLITQFPALVDKAPVKITQQRYFGWTWERNDIAYVKAFLGKEWIAKLQGLQKGEFIYQCREKTELIKTVKFGDTTRAEGFNYAFSPIQICEAS